MGVVKITSVYMLMGMLILISLYNMKTCSIALLLVFPNLVTFTLFAHALQKKEELARPTLYNKTWTPPVWNHGM